MISVIRIERCSLATQSPCMGSERACIRATQLRTATTPRHRDGGTGSVTANGSGCATLVAMVQAADLWKGDNGASRGWLYGPSRKRRGDTRDKHDCYNTGHKKLLVVLPFMLSERRFFMLCERHFVGGPMHNSRNCGNYGAGSSDKPSTNTTRRRLPSMK
jgi:hypothetical protein